MNEVEKIEKNPQTGRNVKKKMEEYEYDPDLEPAYMSSMLKQFNKTLSEGYFPMVIVDAVNSKITDFDQFWSCAKVKGFEAFVVELKESVEVCTSRNTHNRARKEIEVLAAQWESTPAHFLQLDVTSLLYDRAIDEVDMEMANSDEENSDEDSKLDNLKKPPDKTNWMVSRNTSIREIKRKKACR
jgi:YLP motif-containing protein 1